MLIQPYALEELQFAYCYRVYLRWRTYRAQSCAPLTKLDKSILSELAQPYDIHVLETASDSTDLLSEVSLKPLETISGAAGKLKGQVSKWLRTELQLQQPTNLLSLGYFACTVGNSTSVEVDAYLDSQGKHHGYSARALAPVYLKKYKLDETNITPRHAKVISQFHIVLATTGRIGVFGSELGRHVAERWSELQRESRFALLKVSFVPDHVHIAMRLHPSMSPGSVAISLMNAAQELMSRELVSVGINRLW
ncbi:MAG TPA: transposase [Pyrinomonadaceae bacterium]|nr:transposase [Pyrinomonadaceae bacterium]